MLHSHVDEGVAAVVFGIRRLSSRCVELENGKMLCKPQFDCRACCLLNITCEELESPCKAALEKCDKDVFCEDCERLAECLEEKPCCWECSHLFKCLAMFRDAYGKEYVEDAFGCSWDEFTCAVKMLAVES